METQDNSVCEDRLGIMASEGADEPKVLQIPKVLGLTPRLASIMGELIEDSFKPFARLVLPPIFQVMADKPIQ